MPQQDPFNLFYWFSVSLVIIYDRSFKTGGFTTDRTQRYNATGRENPTYWGWRRRWIMAVTCGQKNHIRLSMNWLLLKDLYIRSCWYPAIHRQRNNLLALLHPLRLRLKPSRSPDCVQNGVERFRMLQELCAQMGVSCSKSVSLSRMAFNPELWSIFWPLNPLQCR